MEGLTQEERSRLIRSVGTHRGARPLSPIEVGRFFAQALQHSSPEAVAKEVDFRGTSMVTRFVRLLELPEEFHPLVDWGHSDGSIPFTAASAVGGLSRETQRTLLNLLVSGGIDTLTLRHAVPILRKGRSVEEAVKEAGKLRPIIIRRHLIIGAVGIPDRERVSSLEQAQRDIVIKTALKGLLSESDLTAARLLPERFTIVTNDSGKDSIDAMSNAKGITFEHLVQGQIHRVLDEMSQ